MTGTEYKLSFAALTLELAAVALLFLGSTDSSLLYRYFILHAMACLMMTPVAWALLPPAYRMPRLRVMFLLFSLCFFIPVLGLLGFFFGVVFSSWWPFLRARLPFAQIAEPQYEVAKPSVQLNRLRLGQVRSQFASPDAPLELRMKALMAIQHVSPRHSSDVLRDALTDQVDDLRLLAYGMLERQEKRIAASIQQALSDLAKAKNERALYAANKQLAELYWELVYQGLVQGDMREYALGQVRHYVQEALRHHVRDSGLWVVSGRVRLMTGDYSGAMGAFSTAIGMGLPKSRAEPYLAELAFMRGDMSAVRQHMRQLQGQNLSHGMSLLADFWGEK